MRGNRVLLLVVIVLAVIVAFVMHNDSSSTIRGELKDFAVQDTGAVDKMFLADKLGHTSLLERKSAGVWMINNQYVARQDAVNSLLFTLNKMTVRAPVAKSMEETVLKNLSGPGQRKVEVYSKGTLIKTIFVGLENADNHGTYMLLEHSSVPFELHIQGHRGFLQTRFITDARLWRDPEIFQYFYKDIRSVNMDYVQAPQNSFQLNFNGKDLQLLHEGKQVPKVDTLSCLEYLNGFKRITYEYMVTDESFPAERKDSILTAGPWAIVTVTDKAGNKNTVKCFRRSGGTDPVDPRRVVPYDVDRFYGMLNDKDFVLIQYYQFDKVLRNVDSFLLP